MTICDQLIVFSPHMTDSNSLFGPLVFHVEPKLTHNLNEFLNEKVFVEDDDGKCGIYRLNFQVLAYRHLNSFSN